MNWRSALAAALFGILCLLRSHDARANMAKWWSEGEFHGPLVPQDDTDIRVDSEELSFVIAPSLSSAEVTATYHMTNGGEANAKANIAFVMVTSEAASRNAQDARKEPRASVTIDGEPVTGRVVTEAQVIAPLLGTWLTTHPEAEKELARLSAMERPKDGDWDALHALAPGCRGECDDLLRWYRNRDAEDHVRAAQEAIPEQVANLERGWTKRADSGPLAWLTFPLPIGAGATRTIRVQYTHISGNDSHLAVNEVFTYVYLLSPAKRWARFGELHIDIQVPPETTIQSSSIPFEADASGTMYRTNLSRLPDGELDFGVMSKRGLLFGMSQPTGYWLILMALMAIVTIPASARLGRTWANSSTRLRLALKCIFGTGVAAFLWNCLLMIGLGALFPHHAFGNSYSAMFGFTTLMFFYVLAAIIISLVATRAQMPKAATPD